MYIYCAICWAILCVRALASLVLLRFGLVISTLCLSRVLYASRDVALSIVTSCICRVFCYFFAFLLPKDRFIPFSPLFPFVPAYFPPFFVFSFPFVYVQDNLNVCSVCLFLYVFSFLLLFMCRILF